MTADDNKPARQAAGSEQEQPDLPDLRQAAQRGL